MMSVSAALSTIHGEKDGTMMTTLRRLSLVGVGVLLLALPYRFPQWEVYATQVLWKQRLFLGAFLLTLLFLLVCKYPQWQVAAVRERKDRIALEAQSRHTLAHLVGGAVLLLGLYGIAQTFRTTQEGHRTDRLTTAIAQLGTANAAAPLATAANILASYGQMCAASQLMRCCSGISMIA